MHSKYDDLEKIKSLRDEGVLSEQDFEIEKAKILQSDQPMNDSYRPWGMAESGFCMLLHLSQLTSILLPFAGLVLPIIMWGTEKENSEGIDLHGKVVLNWVFSSLIYFFVSFLLAFVIIGIPMLFMLMILNIVFVIIGAVRANNGVVWKYPLSIQFFNVDIAEKPIQS